ncbi:MAG: hypothetical protein ACREH6_12550 [Geminicoccaceae bacterium]
MAGGALRLLSGARARRGASPGPENALKLAVGVLLSAFGVFWIGAGVGFPWLGEDLAIPGLVLGFLLAALLSVRLARGACPAAGRIVAGGGT